jgi:uncharacterized membrane protein (UPF0127 family)
MVVGVAAMVVGAIVLVVALLGRSGGSDGAAPTTTRPTGVTLDLTSTTAADAPTASTAPVGSGGIGVGTAPARRGRTPLRGFSEVRAWITAKDGTVCEVCLLAATTRAEQERGLMEVTDPTLGGYDGMAFLYSAPTDGAFWMRNTPMPLSIAYFDSHSQLIKTYDMAPCADSPDCKDYPADKPFAVALEVPQGRLGSFGVRPGSRIEVSLEDCPLASKLQGRTPPTDAPR